MTGTGTLQNAHIITLYASAAVNLYGALSVFTLCKIYNSHKDGHITEDEAKKHLLAHSGEAYVLLGDDVVFPAGEETGALLTHLKRETEGKPRFVPNSRAAFLRYLELYDFGTEEWADKFLSCVQGVLKSDDAAQQFLREASEMLRLDYPVSEFLSLFEQYGVKNAESDMALMACVIDAKNHARLWKNKGFTPVEIAKLRPTYETLKKTIGRNDPC